MCSAGLTSARPGQLMGRVKTTLVPLQLAGIMEHQLTVHAAGSCMLVSK